MSTETFEGYLLHILDYIYNQGPSTEADIFIDARVSGFDINWSDLQNALSELFNRNYLTKTTHKVPSSGEFYAYSVSSEWRPNFRSRKRKLKTAFASTQSA